MIVKDRKVLRVECFDMNGIMQMVPSSLGIISREQNSGYKVDLVPYINDVSKKRDPMIREINNKLQFTHLSTLLERYDVSNILFKTEDGKEFGINDVIKVLWK